MLVVGPDQDPFPFSEMHLDAIYGFVLHLGELLDQAALAGVLAQIYNLRLSILSVQRLENANDDTRASQPKAG